VTCAPRNLRGQANKGIEQNARDCTLEERRLRVCSYLTRWAERSETRGSGESSVDVSPSVTTFPHQHLVGLGTIGFGVVLFRYADLVATLYPFYLGFDKPVTDYYMGLLLRIAGVLIALIGLTWLLTGW